jgi:N-acyl amino acid synthase of PEP-CTERM/exosortase system
MFLSAMTASRLSEGYKQYFEIVPAVTEALKWESYHLRHEVYCQELGFEPEHVGEVEMDEYDHHSVHCLVRAVATRRFIGCVRIIFTNPTDPNLPLPFEKACATTLDRSIIDPAKLDRSKIAEVSRLAIIDQYRRRRGERDKPFTIVNDDDGSPEQPKSKVRLPYLALGLYLALVALAKHYGIERLFLLTEPCLATSISHLGVAVKHIGSGVEHRGLRVPSVLEVDDILANMNPLVRPFYNLIAEEVETGLLDKA